MTVNYSALSVPNLSLAANSETATHLSGRIVPQSGGDLDKLGSLFSQFLNGENITLQTTGQSVQPPGSSGTVDWLTAAFQSLTLDVILPGQKLQVGDSFNSFNKILYIILPGYQRN